jgi:SAM-dependent methyltransferase
VRLFRREQTDPDAFYTFLAHDTVGHLRQFVDLRDAVAVDVGGGPGYTAEALRAAGARCCVIEYDFDEMLLHDRQPEVAVQGDGQSLPIASASVDICHSSNVLEHVADPFRMLDEMARVLKPGTGVGYVTFTNWFSPWGGHETSPWHYFGGERAARRYERRYGHPPKNRFGISLFPLHVHEVQRWFAARSDLEVLWQGPRYLPDSLAWTSRVPGLREVVTWNLAVAFRRSN